MAGATPELTARPRAGFQRAGAVPSRHLRSNLPQSNRVTSPETCSTLPSRFTRTRTGSLPRNSTRIAPVLVVAPTAKPNLRNCLMTSFCLSNFFSGTTLKSVRLEHDEPLAGSARHGFGSAGGAKFDEDRADVEFHGMLRDAQARGDRLVAEPFGEHPEHVDFARCERLTGRL